MCISSEDTLVIHDVKGLSIIFLIIIVRESVVALILELVLLADHFRLRSLERLSHNFKFIELNY